MPWVDWGQDAGSCRVCKGAATFPPNVLHCAHGGADRATHTLESSPDTTRVVSSTSEPAERDAAWPE